jgi:hypothetical protein
MGITEGTVRNHISNILRKTGLENRTQIAIHAINGGFTQKRKNKASDGDFRNNVLYGHCLSASSVPLNRRVQV